MLLSLSFIFTDQGYLPVTLWKRNKWFQNFLYRAQPVLKKGSTPRHPYHALEKKANSLSKVSTEFLKIMLNFDQGCRESFFFDDLLESLGRQLILKISKGVLSEKFQSSWSWLVEPQVYCENWKEINMIRALITFVIKPLTPRPLLPIQKGSWPPF